MRYLGVLASELKGETIPLGEHILSYTRREPIGEPPGFLRRPDPMLDFSVRHGLSTDAILIGRLLQDR